MSLSFLKVYLDLFEKGIETAPRGRKVIELENYQFTLQPFERFTSFEARHMSFKYLAAEWRWYLNADPYDNMIADRAQMWTEIRQPDGRYFSNYGYYWFGKPQGVRWVVEELLRDRNSRRAVIPMLSFDHLFPSNKDVVCTEAISFRIRDDALNMSVNMRSNDAIWGMTNDVACFSFLHELIAGLLQLPVGNYCHKVDSLHVYERHFKMLDNILSEGESGYKEIHCPLMDNHDIHYQYTGCGPRGVFSEWLHI